MAQPRPPAAYLGPPKAAPGHLPARPRDVAAKLPLGGWPGRRGLR